MQKKIYFFFLTLILSLCILPGFNLLKSKKSLKSFELNNLFNTDVLRASINYLFFQVGISTDPQQVIIGKEGWFFLGNKYANNLEISRKPANKEDIILVSDILNNLKLWEKYFNKHSSTKFVFLIGPNKDSIYSEHLPLWAQPDSQRITDHFYESKSSVTNLLDLRTILLEEKQKYPSNLLYFKTDTHWNPIGASIAYSSMMSQLFPELKSFNLKDKYSSGQFSLQSKKGDLTSFLGIENFLEEQYLAINLPEINASAFRFNDYKNHIEPFHKAHGMSKSPIHIISKNALNDKRVLWLRDSFGTALSPIMTATFSDIVHMHWSSFLSLPDKELESLVNSYSPDLIIFTVVERDSRNLQFLRPPPL